MDEWIDLHKLQGKVLGLGDIDLKDQESLMQPNWGRKKKSQEELLGQNGKKRSVYKKKSTGLKMTYETSSYSPAFASWQSGCFLSDSKQTLWLLYYTPEERKKTEKASGRAILHPYYDACIT